MKLGKTPTVADGQPYYTGCGNVGHDGIELERDEAIAALRELVINVFGPDQNDPFENGWVKDARTILAKYEVGK